MFCLMLHHCSSNHLHCWRMHCRYLLMIQVWFIAGDDVFCKFGGKSSLVPEICLFSEITIYKKWGKKYLFWCGEITIQACQKVLSVFEKSKKKKNQPFGLYWLIPPQISFAPFFSTILSANKQSSRGFG